MINRTNRAIATVLAFFLVISMVFAPALTASADDMSAASAELVVSTEAMDVSAKLAAGEDGLALLAAMGANGETVADLNLFITAAGLILQSTPALDQAYGVDIAKLAENLPNSVFAPNSGSSLALDQETYDSILNALQSAPAAVEASLPFNVEALLPAVEAFTNFIQEQGEPAVTALMGSAEMNMAPTTVDVLGESIEVSMTTITFGPEALANYFTAIADGMAADTALQEALVPALDELINSGVMTLTGEIAGMTGAELVGAVAQALPEATEQIQQFLTENKLAVSVSMAADKTTGEPVCIGASLSANDQTAGLGIVMTGNIYGVAAVVDGEEMGAYLVIADSSEDGFSGYVTVQASGEEVGRLSLDVEFATGAYALGITSNGETVTASGTISAIDDGVSITLEAVDGQEFPGTIALLLRGSDAIAVPAFAEILSMSEEEIMTVVQNAMPVVESLMSSLGVA